VLITAWSCGGAEPPAPPVATPTLTLNHERAPAGSPLDLTYKFVVAEGAAFAEDYRVFVHVVDADEERMWSDDHNPPTPTSQWRPGQTIEYTRTIFVPVFPYIGNATINIGLHTVKSQPSGEQTRLPLAGEDVGQRAYRVARLELLPQTENLFTIFKDGWHPAELAGDSGGVEWQWTKKEATLAFKNPRKDTVLFLDLDSPISRLVGGQQVRVLVGGQTVDDFSLGPDQQLLRKVKIQAAQLGDAEMAEIRISTDKSIVPALTPEAASKDPRELGVRVFHAFVDPR
jgi:hypothetical protein